MISVKCQIDMYLHVRTEIWDNFTKKRKHHPSQEDDASMAEAAPGRLGEISKVRHVALHRMVDLSSS